MTISKTEAFAVLLAITLMFAGIVVLFQGAQPVMGSTIQGNDYQSTSTAAGSAYGTIGADKLVKTGQGSLASVIVTGAAAGPILLLDATTTDINKRTGNTSTSSILIASIPASLAAGTYTFDVEYTTGLYINLLSGTMPTSTITYR